MNLEKLEIEHSCIPMEDYHGHAKLTADVAVKFWQWLRIEQETSNIILTKSDEELFDHFINNVYKPE